MSVRNDGNGNHPRERRARSAPRDVAPVRLTRKYAEEIDGVDLSGRNVGDRLPLRERDARLLIAEGWAEPAAARDRRQHPELIKADAEPEGCQRSA